MHRRHARTLCTFVHAVISRIVLACLCVGTRAQRHTTSTRFAPRREHGGYCAVCRHIFIYTICVLARVHVQVAEEAHWYAQFVEVAGERLQSGHCTNTT